MSRLVSFECLESFFLYFQRVSLLKMLVYYVVLSVKVCSFERQTLKNGFFLELACSLFKQFFLIPLFFKPLEKGMCVLSVKNS